MAAPASPLLREIYAVVTLRPLRHAWRDLLPRWRIALAQRLHLARVGAGRRDRNIIYLVAGHDAVTGGAMSIVSQADESEALRDVHGADVFVCPNPGEPQILRYTKFRNTRTLAAFPMLLRRLPPSGTVLVHIPEVYLGRFLEHGTATLRRHGGMRFRFNLMLQNIDLCPTPAEIARLKALGPVTVTTAHRAYSDAATAQRLGCDVHHLSTWVSPEQYERRALAAKRDLITVSPDANPVRDRVLARLREGLPGFEFRVIQNMSYETYKETVAQARYSLTFGEGLDGYFAEPVFSGGIGFAVYNDRFFTPNFRGLPGVYDNWEELAERLPADIRALNDPAAYARVHARQYDLLAETVKAGDYRAKLAAFYTRYFNQHAAG